MKSAILRTALFAFALAPLLGPTAQAACAEDFTDEVQAQLISDLNQKRPILRDIRLAIGNDSKHGHISAERRAAISTTTLRLEYWAKDFVRYVETYGKSHREKVCERLTGADRQHVSDFVVLTFFSSMPALAPVEFETYK